MAVIKIIVEDENMDEGTYRMSFEAKGPEIEQGRATAAYFTGFYMNLHHALPGFKLGCSEYRNKLMGAMASSGITKPTTKRATCVLTLTDDEENVGSGRYYPVLASEGGDPKGESLPTEAQIVGSYMRSLLNSQEFAKAVWDFADEFVKNHADGSIENANSAPSNDDAEDTIAA